MSRLDHIIRLRKWELDEKRRVLSDLQRESDELQNALDRLGAEVAAESRRPAGEFEAVTFAAYLEGARQRRQLLHDRIERKEEEITRQQDAVSEAFKELKTFEVARDRETEREMRLEARIEQQGLDEQGLRAFVG
ncbi:flagellar export protein FliJ [Pseudokordiimonas caeni]|uniref:flagellar export protein FliJ n=1 Tax=Pseudokordiimonas caeni TaxID=2997908 RepID=UPI002810F6C3|nr:flagellar export protein FliJ [Pseudokordiimonas caeni]